MYNAVHNYTVRVIVSVCIDRERNRRSVRSKKKFKIGKFNQGLLTNIVYFSVCCLWFQIAMESEIRDVFRHCIQFPVPISASVIADELLDTANEKRCITVLTSKFNLQLIYGL